MYPDKKARFVNGGFFGSLAVILRELLATEESRRCCSHII